MEYQYHPACLVLPRMSADEFTALRASVKTGYDKQFPIVLFDGKILDGRHRYEAATAESVAPAFTTLTDIDPFDYVRRVNGARRSWLSQEQKALVLGRLIEQSADYQAERERIREEANKARAEAAKEQHTVSNPRVGEKKQEVMVSQQSVGTPKNEEKKQTKNPAAKSKAKMLDVNEGAVNRASLIEKKAPELADKVASGEITASAALREIRHKEIIANTSEPKPMPDGKYSVIYADPPWRYEFSETGAREIENHYPTMSLEEIKGLQIPSHDNAILFLWGTAPKLTEAIEVMQAWGFLYLTCAVWDKEKIGMGYWFRGQHELLLVGVKGTFNAPIPENRFSSVYRESRTAHSKKPEFYYGMIEQMLPGEKYLELFARQKHSDKWVVWGNQV